MTRYSDSPWDSPWTYPPTQHEDGFTTSRLRREAPAEPLNPDYFAELKVAQADLRFARRTRNHSLAEQIQRRITLLQEKINQGAKQ